MKNKVVKYIDKNYPLFAYGIRKKKTKVVKLKKHWLKKQIIFDAKSIF